MTSLNEYFGDRPDMFLDFLPLRFETLHFAHLFARFPEIVSCPSALTAYLSAQEQINFIKTSETIIVAKGDTHNYARMCAGKVTIFLRGNTCTHTDPEMPHIASVGRCIFAVLKKDTTLSDGPEPPRSWILDSELVRYQECHLMHTAKKNLQKTHC